MKSLRMLDLFAGIGGFSYAGERLVGGYETVAFCEYDEHAQKVLRKHWPDTEIIGDIRELADDAERFRGSVDIVCGGYPCQPFSLAGVRRGDKDDRHLWPEMLRVIEAVRPRWVIGENVAGHITMGLDQVLFDLESEGYTARPFVIPACAVDAPHRRDRVWVVAHTENQGESDGTKHVGEGKRLVGNSEHDGSSATALSRSAEETSNKHKERQSTPSEPQRTSKPGNSRSVEASAATANVGHAIGSGQRGDDRRGAEQEPAGRCENVANADSQGLQGQRQQPSGVGAEQRDPCDTRWWLPEPAIRRVSHGIPGRVHRLRQLGNSIVPQVAARILYAIKEVEHGQDAA